MAKKTAARKPPAKRKRATPRISPDELREDRFVQEYAVDLRGKDAAIRAGYSPLTARVQACQMLATERVQEKLAPLLEARAKRTEITGDKVLERVFAIATADPRELIELHRECCRYCYGKGNRYQRTPREMEEFRKEFDDKLAEKAKLRGITVEEMEDEFDSQGGIGWDPRKDPNQDCPECHGRGVEHTYAKDQRDLSPGARLLYAGTKTTEKGVEIKMHSQTDMLIKAGMQVGLFKSKVELTGKNGGPVEHDLAFAELVDSVGGADVGIGKAKGRKADHAK